MNAEELPGDASGGEEPPASGDCYRRAFLNFRELSKIKQSGLHVERGWNFDGLCLVHGVAVPPVGPDAGKAIYHAWIELGGDVLEMSSGNQERYSNARWTTDFGAKARIRYTIEEAEAMFKKFGHCGPWDTDDERHRL